MGVTIGTLAVLLPVYGYWPGLLIIFGLILIPYIITHNIAISIGLALVALPFITWLGMDSGRGTIATVILGLVIGIKFLPTTRTAWGKAERKDDFIFDHWRRDRDRDRDRDN